MCDGANRTNDGGDDDDNDGGFVNTIYRMCHKQNNN